MRKPVFRVCEKHRCRPACASAQSDQHLCYSLIGKYNISTCIKQVFNFLASLCSWYTGLSITLSETLKTGFVASRPKCCQVITLFPPFMSCVLCSLICLCTLIAYMYIANLMDLRSSLIRAHNVLFHDKGSLECIWLYGTDVISRQWVFRKRGTSVVSTIASGARGLGFNPRSRRGKISVF